MNLHVGARLSKGDVISLLDEARQRTLLLTQSLSEHDLGVQHDPLMSPILWDLGHIGHFEEVWLLEMLDGGDSSSEGLRGIYNPFEHPRATRADLDLPTYAECGEYLDAVRQTALERLAVEDQSADSDLLRDGFVYRMVLQHEYQHNETILQTLQLKGGEPYHPVRTAGPSAVPPEAPPPGSMVRFPGGQIRHGTDDRSAAYDNERPAHQVEIPPFRIGAHAVTNGEYLGFMEDGGYDRSDAWSADGWAWKKKEGLVSPKYWARGASGWQERSFDATEPIDHTRPVCHICYWEADAYARWAGLRLPTEAEWEAAASWNPTGATKSIYPWGDAAPAEHAANLDARSFRPAPIGSYPAGVSAVGCWGMLGDVWEWTSTDFYAYPGYETFPYPEYSEVFFGDEHKVLRGGAWATRFGATRNTFRNWDYPIRRQIFSGVRCAQDD
jgi:iron(II)-dependent oxidoreductase